MGEGACTTSGYYKGLEDDADHATMDAEKCAIHCNKEPECLYFAVLNSKTCSRYNPGDGNCIKDGRNDGYQLYRKISTYVFQDTKRAKFKIDRRKGKVY